MPRRIIDGEALWRSRKMLLVPSNYRAEYANLIPLANDKGYFEASADKVWAEVYCFNRQDWTVGQVEEMLVSFECAGMIIRKKAKDGKLWGKFVNIESRLPTNYNRGRKWDGGVSKKKEVKKIQTYDPLTFDAPESEFTPEQEEANKLKIGV